MNFRILFYFKETISAIVFLLLVESSIAYDDFIETRPNLETRRVETRPSCLSAKENFRFSKNNNHRSDKEDPTNDARGQSLAEDVDLTWEKYKERFNKTYLDLKEDERHKKIYEKNYEFIKTFHKIMGEILGLNTFLDCESLNDKTCIINNADPKKADDEIWEQYKKAYLGRGKNFSKNPEVNAKRKAKFLEKLREYDEINSKANGDWNKEKFIDKYMDCDYPKKNQTYYDCMNPDQSNQRFTLTELQ